VISMGRASLAVAQRYNNKAHDVGGTQNGVSLPYNLTTFIIK
jgi:hypothetical protein